ncbi:aminotransferase class V-fold PLP-dependent enzyme [Hoeflea sp. WL0058]|uniref:Aminotransferase class V-fold PLP-dependent enzyme n=1 Tax=Flavimaribacter sediminis TaxID=2865987 RepID=A0AAE2ZPY1_9HYPH|nr:aminotransferase class V-fold PLP-dependent enzyme [Flavimaribacter sediminis]MBW8638700.1 aminotransferase class V-fold PLP-dependent enzyme [Flavimaribacter sediminis]
MQIPTLTFEMIRRSVIGDAMPMPGPFGPRSLIYADHIASGRALSFIEDAIRDHILPAYGNTHTETSWCGRQTTHVREAARQAIRTSVGADEDHAVIFAGAGATAAADKLARALDLGPDATVFIGPYEHHSNDLTWRETKARIVRIPLNQAGELCLDTLAEELRERQGGGPFVGAFSAASNVTGVLTDLPALARLLHAYDGLLICDFAAAGPYVPVRLRASAPGETDRIDAALFSAHKFPGGPGASGVLVADRRIFDQKRPTMTGGGTVSYVTAEKHVYVEDPERREEAGTPAIIDNIRAGMVFDLKARMGDEVVAAQEEFLTQRLDNLLTAEPAVELLSPPRSRRLGIFSFNIRAGERLLHHNFVVALLNDLFGIQARGGCSCAGPYGHDLLGIDSATAWAHERAVARGYSVFRPGWARLGVSWFFDEETVDQIKAAIAFIAHRGLSVLPAYRLDAASGVWRPDPAALPGMVETIEDAAPDFAQMWFGNGAAPTTAPDFETCLAIAHEIADLAERHTPEVGPAFDAESEKLRWFWMPVEASRQLRGAA